MKKFILIYFIIYFAVFCSCDDKISVDFKGDNLVQFRDGQGLDDKRHFSFVFYHSDIRYDTVKIRVQLMGELRDYPLHFKLVQVEDYDWEYEYDAYGYVIDSTKIIYEQAVEGVHFLPLDESEWYIPEGKTYKDMRVIFMRDVSLMQGERSLRLRIETDGINLKTGLESMIETRLYITDQLTILSFWASQPSISLYYLGDYSQVKHRWMMDVSQEVWDDEYLTLVAADISWLQFYNRFFKAELDKYNREHGTLMDENNKPVTFP